jgi:hypothetical protein
MSQTITEDVRLESGLTGRISNVGLWILQIGAAGMFLMVGFFKLSGDPRMVGLFDAIGVGQWFRYVTRIVGSPGRGPALDSTPERSRRIVACGRDAGRGCNAPVRRWRQPARGDHSLDCHGHYRVGTTQANDESLSRDTVRIECLKRKLYGRNYA